MTEFTKKGIKAQQTLKVASQFNSTLPINTIAKREHTSVLMIKRVLIKKALLSKMPLDEIKKRYQATEKTITGKAIDKLVIPSRVNYSLVIKDSMTTIPIEPELIAADFDDAINFVKSKYRRYLTGLELKHQWFIVDKSGLQKCVAELFPFKDRKMV